MYVRHKEAMENSGVDVGKFLCVFLSSGHVEQQNNSTCAVQNLTFVVMSLQCSWMGLRRRSNCITVFTETLWTTSSNVCNNKQRYVHLFTKTLKLGQAWCLNYVVTNQICQYSVVIIWAWILVLFSSSGIIKFKHEQWWNVWGWESYFRSFTMKQWMCVSLFRSHDRLRTWHILNNAGGIPPCLTFWSGSSL